MKICAQIAEEALAIFSSPESRPPSHVLISFVAVHSVCIDRESSNDCLSRFL